MDVLAEKEDVAGQPVDTVEGETPQAEDVAAAQDVDGAPGRVVDVEVHGGEGAATPAVPVADELDGDGGSAGAPAGPDVGEDAATDPLKPRVMGFLANDLGEAESELLGIFNTFRMGRKWYDLDVGEGVAISLNGETLPGTARVMAVHTGALEDMLAMHSGLAYGCGSSTPSTRRQELRDVLARVYGSGVRDFEACTVVYLER